MREHTGEREAKLSVSTGKLMVIKQQLQVTTLLQI